MKKRFVVVLACLLLLGGLLVVGVAPAGAAPPLKTYHCHGELTIGEPVGTFPGPFNGVSVARANCTHIGVADFEIVSESFVDFVPVPPFVFPCVTGSGQPGITGTLEQLVTGTTPNGKSQQVQTRGPISQCFPTAPSGVVTESVTQTFTTLVATGKFGDAGCEVTLSVVQTTDFDAVPQTLVFDTQTIDVSC